MNRLNRNALKKPSWMAVCLGGALSLGGCASTHLSDDFGHAVRQNIAAQIANPDAHFVGAIAPGSNASRVAAAQDRYIRGKVIQPSNQVAATSIAAAPPTSSPLQ